jgi:hypothetical protein
MSKPTTERHPFEWTGGTYRSPAGRTYRICATCGRPNVAQTHTKRGEGRLPRYLPPAAPAPVSVAPVSPRIIDWRVRMLALAVEEVLAHSEISDVLEVRVREVKRALNSELYGTSEKARPILDPPELPRAAPLARPVTPPLATAAHRRMAGSFRSNRMRDLFERGIRAGWVADETGGGHVRLKGPAGGILIMSASAADRGRGFRNLVANAKRMGIDTTGL